LRLRGFSFAGGNQADEIGGRIVGGGRSGKHHCGK
jgi:hypothetical protein